MCRSLSPRRFGCDAVHRTGGNKIVWYFCPCVRVCACVSLCVWLCVCLSLYVSNSFSIFLHLSPSLPPPPPFHRYLVSPNQRAAAASHALPVYDTPPERAAPRGAAERAGGELDFFATFAGGSDSFNLKRQWAIYDALRDPARGPLPDDEALMAALRARAAAEPPAALAAFGAKGSTDEYPAGVWDALPAEYRDSVCVRIAPAAVVALGSMSARLFIICLSSPWRLGLVRPYRGVL